MNQTKGFLFFGCFLLVAGLAFVLVFALRSGIGERSYNCDLVAMEPNWPNINSLKNYVSKDDTMIANYAGFIKFIHFDELTEKVFYLPLELIGLRYTSFREHNLLVLETSCANLELLVHQNENQTTTIKQLLAFWHKPYRSYNHCYVQTQKLDTPTNTHYSCNKQEVYNCFHSTDVDVWDQIELVTDKLEFEVNGDPYFLRQGLFSTDAKDCTR